MSLSVWSGLEGGVLVFFAFDGFEMLYRSCESFRF